MSSRLAVRISPVVVATFVAALCSAWLLGAGPARADDEGVEQIVSVLRAKGLIDESEQTEILAKHVASQRKSVAAGPSLLSGLEFWGDFRLRWEASDFQRDAFGVSADDQSRSLYRLRLGARKQVNDHVAVVFQVASGYSVPSVFCCDDDWSLGDSLTFGPDPLKLDRAFVEFSLPESSYGFEGKLLAGRLPNPFTWDKGRDSMIYDPALNLEGATLQLKLPLPGEQAWLFANAGVYLAAEQMAHSDPKLIGMQLGGGYRPLERVEVGLRASSYWWRSLQSGNNGLDFVPLATAYGNLPNAFQHERRARIGELAGYLQYAPSDDWPLLLWGNAARNFSASRAVFSGIPVGAENMGYAAGLQIGDSSKFLGVGLAFFRIESNAVIAQLTDRELFDGLTNGVGYAIYLARALWPGVEVQVAFYDSDSVHDRGSSLGPDPVTNPFFRSIANRDRRQIQTNLLVRF